MARLYLSLGSNLGDREANLNEAFSRLDSVFGARYASSPIINTKACGFCGPDFLNCIVVYETRRRPETLLRICKQIEADMGRTDTPEFDENGCRLYHDRVIDIDILIYGKKKVSTPNLVIPHPQVFSRPYVKELLGLLPCQDILQLL